LPLRTLKPICTAMVQRWNRNTPMYAPPIRTSLF
jgi:hypothetical protein